MLIFLACAANGVDETYPALIFTGAVATLLLACTIRPEFRRELARIRLPWSLIAAFGATLLVALWSLSPWVPGGPQPVWSFTDASGAGALDRSRVIVEVIKLLGLACVFVVGLVYGAAERQGRRLGLAILIGGAVFALWSLSVFAAAAQTGGARLNSGLPSANIAGTLWAVLLLLAFSLPSMASRRRPSRNQLERVTARYAPTIALALLFGACLLLTASRGAMIAAALGGVVYLGFRALTAQLKRWELISAGLLAALISLGMFLTKGDIALARFQRFQVDATGRKLMIAAHFKAFLLSPIMGYGLRSFDAVNKFFMTAQTYPELRNVRATHNVYVQWLEEAGLLGALPMFLTVVLIMVPCLKSVLSGRRSSPWLSALLVADIVFLIHGLSDFTLEVPAMAALWTLLLGLQYGLVTSGRRVA